MAPSFPFDNNTPCRAGHFDQRRGFIVRNYIHTKKYLPKTLALVLASLSGLALADGRVQGYVTGGEQGIALQGAKVRIKEL